jgi:hypothetical protein
VRQWKSAKSELLREPEVLYGRGRPAGAPLRFVFAARAQGVGSVNEPPKMSLFPNVAGQSLCRAGFGFGAAGPRLSAIRQASSAGQSAAFRTLFRTAAPCVRVAAA